MTEQPSDGPTPVCSPDQLTSDEVAAYAGISFRRLDYYRRRGLIDGPSARGSGHPRRWTPAETRTVCLFARLVWAGLDLSIAAHLARQGIGAHEVAPGITIEIAP